mmetsp:Transcript_101109/g.291029  ORF Transcript_101109/g.291029 Transcript_101109/m.291029 type:complete len:225 (+) Transcript_101109:1020-1694(+)
MGPEHRWRVAAPGPCFLVHHTELLQLRQDRALRPHRELRRAEVQGGFGKLRREGVSSVLRPRLRGVRGPGRQHAFQWVRSRRKTLQEPVHYERRMRVLWHLAALPRRIPLVHVNDDLRRAQFCWLRGERAQKAAPNLDAHHDRYDHDHHDHDGHVDHDVVFDADDILSDDDDGCDDSARAERRRRRPQRCLQHRSLWVLFHPLHHGPSCGDRRLVTPLDDDAYA